MSLDRPAIYFPVRRYRKPVEVNYRAWNHVFGPPLSKEGQQLIDAWQIRLSRYYVSDESSGSIIIAVAHDSDFFDSRMIQQTPTFDEAAEAFQAGADVLALDGTERPRPRGEDLGRLIERIHAEFAIPVMADVSSLEEGLRAASLGVDALASTLSGYVEGSPNISEPDLQLVRSLAASVDIPVVAEGRYQSPQEAAVAIEVGLTRSASGQQSPVLT